MSAQRAAANIESRRTKDGNFTRAQDIYNRGIDGCGWFNQRLTGDASGWTTVWGELQTILTGFGLAGLRAGIN